MVEYVKVNEKLEPIEVSSIPQSQLTSDCWLVQFRGLKACAECKEYLKPNCGGGKTLLSLIFSKSGENLATKWDAQEYFNKQPEANFYDFIQHAKEGVLIFVHGLRWYKKQIKLLRIMHKEPGGLDLDKEYPYQKIKDIARLAHKSGYHQARMCTCNLTTSKGAYRDEIYQLGNITLTYYHQHCIGAYNPSIGELVISSCGFRTSTTKERINWVLSQHGYNIYQARLKWFVRGQHTKKEMPFHDGLTLKVD